MRNADDSRTWKQKKLLLYNLHELHAHFCEEHPEWKIGFSEFAMLEPEHCILAGASGTHTVCVCTLQKKWKLMLKVSCSIFHFIIHLFLRNLNQISYFFQHESFFRMQTFDIGRKQ